MRKFLVVSIPLISLILFIGIMLSDILFKTPIGNYDDIPKSMEELIEIVQTEKWDEAYNKSKELDENWKRVVKLLQFSSERDEINFFTTSLARLEGAILVKDKQKAVIELMEAYDHWDKLGQ